jgi:beta-lactamase superfamily II metal-dependent hydrolase
MNVITVNVGQGALTVVRHNKEALIVDSRIPPSNDDTVVFVKQILAVSLKDHFVKGLILTGFDSDHSDVTGVSIILYKYRPDWVMYPKYFKDSDEASLVFRLIEEQEKLRRDTAYPLRRVSVRLDQLNSRILQGLSTNFALELFSPHIEDMDCSNNCSLVLKVTGTEPEGFSYLITGDTENERWEAISRLFGGSLKSDIMAAAHHGSKNATHPASLLHIRPHTVLISAGVDNQYGHPDPQALRVYAEVAEKIYSTNMEGGVSLMTSRKSDTFETKLIPN